MSRFRVLFYARCLQIETSPKKFHRVKKNAVRFAGK
jgi:hypothetical protein